MKRTPVWILVVLTAAFFVVRVAEWHRHAELIGTWIVQWPDQMEVTDIPATMLPKMTLTLYDDGTYTQYLESHVMFATVMYSSGKYTRSGNTVTLNGTQKSYMYDGYQRGTHKGPWTMRLSYTGDALMMGNDPSWDLAFRRKGDHTPPKPKPQPKGSKFEFSPSK
jgi:hypothetical protein